MSEYTIVNGELCHYGVKGQKWGVRRYQNADGRLTDEGKAKYGDDITKRKVKHVKKQFQAGVMSKTIDVSPVSKKINKEMSKTKESKSLESANDYLESIFKSAEAQGISRNQIVFGKDTAKFINDINSAYDKKYKEVASKYVDELASVSLKSLGYKDTKAGRDWLIKQNFIDW